MKNFGLFVLGVIIGALAVYFYCCKGESDLMDADEITAPKGLINPEEAKALDQAYNTRYNIINDSLFKDIETGDNRSSWYALDELKSYLNYAELQADSLGYTLDGLRIYAGAYPDTRNETGLMTMFFIPTGTKNTSEGSLFVIPQGGSGDIEGANGLNKGSQGVPPGANYPQ